MHVVIMGCGRVGSTLAHSAERRGHSVSIIDANPESFRRLGAEFAGDTVTGIGFDPQVLSQAGIERADGFAAVSSGDNSNIISARLARETFGVQRVVARIYDAKRAEVYERLGIPTVATVKWTAERMLRLLATSDEQEIWREPGGSVAILQVRLHPGWVGSSIKVLEKATGARVAYLTRFGVGTLISRSMLIQEGDEVQMLVTDEIAGRVTKIAEHKPDADH